MTSEVCQRLDYRVVVAVLLTRVKANFPKRELMVAYDMAQTPQLCTKITILPEISQLVKWSAVTNFTRDLDTGRSLKHGKA